MWYWCAQNRVASGRSDGVGRWKWGSSSQFPFTCVFIVINFWYNIQAVNLLIPCRIPKCKPTHLNQKTAVFGDFISVRPEAHAYGVPWQVVKVQQRPWGATPYLYLETMFYFIHVSAHTGKCFCCGFLLDFDSTTLLISTV